MKYLLLPILLLLSVALPAQQPGSGKQQMSMGHFYGRVIDSLTGKGVEYATVQLFQARVDSVTHKEKNKIVSGALTEADGSFSMSDLPVMGEFLLLVTAIGYDSTEKRISFGNVKYPQGGMQQMMSAVDKDLGNIPLSPMAIGLDEVVVSADEPLYSIQLDKKVYNVAKDPMSAGTTADEILKNVPSVSVDIDGNVTMRNASPQIFVDGRPTTLSLDQIPSDNIEKIEVISNPSAKYDASGGQAGIINIVLKHNRRIGYNGSVRAGVDMRGKINAGGDMNVRQGKINVFGALNFSQRKSKGIGETFRNSFYSEPNTVYSQNDTVINEGNNFMSSLGLDYFWNNRNTITFSGSYMRGHFNPLTDIYISTDSLYDSITTYGNSYRNADVNRTYRNATGAIQYKHLFPKEGKEWTGDVNYSRSKSDLDGNYYTIQYDENENPLPDYLLEWQTGYGTSEFLTGQTDFVNPIKDKMKIEAGARGAYRNYFSDYRTYVAPNGSEDFTEVPSLGSYEYTDEVFAAYTTFSSTFKKFQYQAGLRAESSFYTGKLFSSAQTFENDFPISLFPSGYITYPVSEKSDVQLSYSRKIDRPGFFQLIPFTDYTDSLNLSRGNPDLKPQFSNTGELNYEKRFDRGNNFSVSAYYKFINHMSTRLQVFETDTILGKDVIINTYANANNSQTMGVELTSLNSIGSWLSITSNLNFFQSVIDGSNLETSLENKRFSWTAKLNTTFKLPMNFTVQITGEYKSRTNVSQGGGGGMSRGMGGMWSASSSAAIQGYVEPIYEVDASIKKEFLKGKAAAITLSFSDIFATDKSETFTNTEFFTQTTARIRDPQFVRLNFSLRFGRFDASLFKRKNIRNNNGEMIPDMQGL